MLRPYIRQAQQLPPGGVNGFLSRTRAAIALRNRSIRWMTRRPLRYLFAAEFGKAESIVLPDYAAAVPPVTR